MHSLKTEADRVRLRGASDLGHRGSPGGTRPPYRPLLSAQPLRIVAIKSYGDLIIALTCLWRSEASESSRLLIGSHLRELFAAAGRDIPTAVIEHEESGVPSIYDIRKNGWFAAVRSALQLRRGLARMEAPRLLFDRIGWRERFLAGSSFMAELPAAENIYLAYEQMLGTGAADRQPKTITPIHPGREIGIFPGSRLQSKNLPVGLVHRIVRMIEQAGATPRLYLLADERPDLEGSGLPYTSVPRNFAAMFAAARACHAIVSADSLPAHIAELEGRPVFVFTPVDNSYWMPRSAYLGRWWGLFVGADARLAKFLTMNSSHV